jgi:uncharacterized membrane protein (DUF485 family)
VDDIWTTLGFYTRHFLFIGYFREYLDTELGTGSILFGRPVGATCIPHRT